ncbi:hypothetical protein AB0G05_42845 [Nonomuraea wenchangensis]
MILPCAVGSIITSGIGVRFARRALFSRLEGVLAEGTTGPAAYGAAFTAILRWQVVCYLAAAALMFLLPRRPVAAHA